MTTEVFYPKRFYIVIVNKNTTQWFFLIRETQSFHNKQALSGKKGRERLLQRVCLLGNGHRVTSRSAQQKNVQGQCSQQVFFSKQDTLKAQILWC